VGHLIAAQALPANRVVNTQLALDNRSVVIVVTSTESLKCFVIVSYQDGSHLLSNRNLPSVVLA